MRKLKYLALVLAVLLVSVNAYAVIDPGGLADVKSAEDDSNTGRDFIDVMVRHTPNDNDELVENYVQAASLSTFIASEGSVVVWATQDRAILGRDVTYTNRGNSLFVAGIISQSGGIASGSYGRMRIYGYFDDVLCADLSDGVSLGSTITTATPATSGDDVLGLAGLADINWPATGTTANISSTNVGIVFGAGSSSDGDEIPAMIMVR